MSLFLMCGMRLTRPALSHRTVGRFDNDTGVFVYYKALCVCAQSCLTLSDPTDSSPSGSSVHGVIQARILETVVISSSLGSSQSRGQNWVSRIAGRFFPIWATREARVDHFRAGLICKNIARCRQPDWVTCIFRLLLILAYSPILKICPKHLSF